MLKRVISIMLIAMVFTGCTSTKSNSIESTSTEPIENKEIYSEATYECSYATDVDPKTLFAESTYCVEAKVIKIHDAVVDEVGGITTPIEIEIVEAKKGDISGTITVSQDGGIASVYNYKKSAKKEVKQKIKVDNIDDEKAKKLYIKETSVDSVELKENKKYLFFINHDDLGYHISSNGYGTLEKMNNKKFKNLISGIEYSDSEMQ